MGLCQSCAKPTMKDINEIEPPFPSEGSVSFSSHPHSDFPSQGDDDREPVITVTLTDRPSLTSDRFSASSSKCSFRDSNGNCFEYEQESRESSTVREAGSTLELLKIPSKDISDDSLQIPKDVTRTRKISWGSVESDTGSRASLSTMSVNIQAKVRRSKSLKTSRPIHDDEIASIKPEIEIEPPPRTRRAISLHLPRKFSTQIIKPKRRSVNEDYLRYRGGSLPRMSERRKSSIQQALSLLSLESFREKKEKPVQKILRQPTRRHDTVRGMSGLAIDGSHQRLLGMDSLYRSQTVYYPTNTSVRQAYGRRYTYNC